MEAKHTPGSWVFGEWSSNKQGVAGEVGWVDVWSKMPDGTSSLPIASCRHKQQMENARLIAAAPELLAALIAMRDAEWGDASDILARRKAADAAIAKATS